MQPLAIKCLTNNPDRFRSFVAAASILFFSAAIAVAASAKYEPLALPDNSKPKTLDLTLGGEKGGRDLPLRVYLPVSRSPAPVVLFSHGLGGSREGNAYLGEHWAARGYISVFVQHPGSDDSVWREKPMGERMKALNQAASLENFMARVKDIHRVLDGLEKFNTTTNSQLFGRLDLQRVGMCGHSFGALTTQAVSGQHFPMGDALMKEPRIKAAIMFSPSAPRRGDAQEAFGQVKIPWLLMTGTKDTAPIGNATLESRYAVFPALPAGGKYEVVLYNAEHSAFSDRALPGDREKRNPNHHLVILALSTAFWDAYLRGDQEAKAWLDGEGPSSVLEKEDRWQMK